MTRAADFAHCEALVREADKDLYLTSLFASDERRPDLLAFYAFALEIARVRERVREPLAGEVRLQWWRDALGGLARGGPSSNPVAAAVLDAVARRGLDVAAMLKLIDARAGELYAEPFATMADLEQHLCETAAREIVLASQVLARVDDAAVAAARPAGVASGLMRLLRRFAFDASAGRVFIPAEVLARHGSSAAEARSGQATEGLRASLAGLRRAAGEERARLRAALPKVANGALAAFLPVALVPLYGRVMERSDYDPFRTAVEAPQWRKQVRLWRAARRPALIAG